MNLTLARPFVNWTEFLSDDLIAHARRTVMEHQSEFVPTKVSTNEENFRSSVVLYHHVYEDLKNRISLRIMEVLPRLQELMQEYIPMTPVSQIEMQLTNSYRNGDMFRRHVDNGSPDCALRRVSCVIYFNMFDTQRFTGGNLLIHMVNGTAIIKPVHNSVCFFPSHIYHEIEPVQSETENFLDGRFTLNAWLWG